MTVPLYRRHFTVACLVLSFSWFLTYSAFAAQTAHKCSATLLVLGDSLSAEYGLKKGTGWVTLLQQRLHQERLCYSVVNASISGETTANGRLRLTQLLAQHRPYLVVIELGGNDALQGLALENTQENLHAMIQAAQSSRAKVLLLGMQVPPNYGKKYAQDFARIFPTVARSTRANLVPFFLRNVADVPHSAQLFQTDRIHPTEAAQPIMLNNVWPTLKKLLR